MPSRGSLERLRDTQSVALHLSVSKPRRISRKQQLGINALQRLSCSELCLIGPLLALLMIQLPALAMCLLRSAPGRYRFVVEGLLGLLVVNGETALLIGIQRWRGRRWNVTLTSDQRCMLLGLVKALEKQRQLPLMHPAALQKQLLRATLIEAISITAAEDRAATNQEHDQQQQPGSAKHAKPCVEASVAGKTPKNNETQKEISPYGGIE